MAEGDDSVKAEAITIKVKDQGGADVHFKVKPHTKFQKIFAAYGQKKGVDFNTIKFLLDGARIKGDDTPAMLGLEDDDTIDAMMEQTGGASL